MSRRPLSPRWQAGPCRLVAPPAARAMAVVFRDAIRSADHAHGYRLALGKADLVAAKALRRAMLQGA